jgi:hypothetical protein
MVPWIYPIALGVAGWLIAFRRKSSPVPDRRR